MKAACPHCFDNTAHQAQGCEKCQQTGYIDVQFADGVVYELWCRTGDHRSLGFHIDAGGDPPPDPVMESICCSKCGAKAVEWRPEGYTEGGEVL